MIFSTKTVTKSHKKSHGQGPVPGWCSRSFRFFSWKPVPESTEKYHADIGKAGSFLMARSYDIFLHFLASARFVGRLLSRSHALAAQPVISGDLW
jgi:hypothetical protein